MGNADVIRSYIVENFLFGDDDGFDVSEITLLDGFTQTIELLCCQTRSE